MANDMIFPEELSAMLRDTMGTELYSTLEAGMMQPPSVSIRLNMAKRAESDVVRNLIDGRVAWCEEGYYLRERPNFTMDPLLHAGAYYVQESSSMFVCYLLRQLIKEPVLMLDLCAAPGGKTTAARAVLPEGSLLVSNETVRKRANVLCENVWKWGHPDVMVTNNSATDFANNPMDFDVVLADVPCSGEGMMRKDETARAQWSRHLVDDCQRLQREILTDIWPSLRNGGILIYSTCTFNTFENERNLQYITDELGATSIAVDIDSSWGITPALMGHNTAYRFLPGMTRGEGLFMAVVRKNGDKWPSATAVKSKRTPRDRVSMRGLTVMSFGAKPDTIKGRATLPHHSSAMMIGAAETTQYAKVEVSSDMALSYLARESFSLPQGSPQGIVMLTYRGLPLGYAKNIGSRVNNLYPQEWRIRNRISI